MNDRPVLPSTSEVNCDEIKLNNLNEIQPFGGLIFLNENLYVTHI